VAAAEAGSKATATHTYIYLEAVNQDEALSMRPWLEAVNQDEALSMRPWLEAVNQDEAHEAL